MSSSPADCEEGTTCLEVLQIAFYQKKKRHMMQMEPKEPLSAFSVFQSCEVIWVWNLFFFSSSSFLLEKQHLCA